LLAKSCADESYYVVSYAMQSTVVWLCGCYVKCFSLTALESLDYYLIVSKLNAS